MRWVILMIVLVSCGRGLTTQETQFSQTILGDGLDTSKVRLIDKAPLRSHTMRFSKRPRVSCGERIVPPRDEEVVTFDTAAVALGNSLYLNHNYYVENYTPEYPERLHLYEAMFLAHELTHIWQWQNRKRTGYHPIKAAKEHSGGADPYLFDPEEERAFSDFGYEQQGAIVAEYVCCAALDPEADRTERLSSMLSKEFPVSRLPVREVLVGWKDVQVKGICR